MKKEREREESLFCYVRWEAEKRLFADEAYRVRIWRTLGAMVREQGCSVTAFCILDDSFHLLLHAEQTAREKSGRIFGGDIGTGWLTPGADGRPKEEALQESDSGWTIRGAKEALCFCADIHLLALRQRYVSRLNDYWFSSWQTYRGAYVWEGLKMAPVLSALSGDQEKAFGLFRRYQKQRTQALLGKR